ncbi:MAG: hypothetical protein QXM75_00470 [Candidatus Diapherotrites archaeon]
MAIGRLREGRPLPDTEEMKIWRKNYENMTFEDHEEKLRSLGFDDQDLAEFKEVWEKERRENRFKK